MSRLTSWMPTPRIAAGHRTVLDQLVDDLLDGRGRDREGDADIAAIGREDRGVDADHLAVEVEGRATGIAGVDRRVDLQEVAVGRAADVAAAGRDDTDGHGAAEAERIADGNDPVADADVFGRKLDEGQIGAFDLDHGEVGALVGADDGRRSVSLPSSKVTVTLVASCDDVVVGDDIAVSRNDEAGAGRHEVARHAGACRAARATLAAELIAELVEEVLERMIVRQIGELEIELAATALAACLGDSLVAFDEIETTAGFTASTRSAKPACGDGAGTIDLGRLLHLGGGDLAGQTKAVETPPRPTMMARAEAPIHRRVRLRMDRAHVD